jgi:acetyl-CoA C-acetyltransferase
VVLAWLKETGYPHERRTSTAARSRSAIRSGATGTKLMTTLLHELERTGGRYGLQTMCEGGGQANVTIIERLSCCSS